MTLMTMVEKWIQKKSESKKDSMSVSHDHCYIQRGDITLRYEYG
jgi:hypothetical protein